MKSYSSEAEACVAPVLLLFMFFAISATVSCAEPHTVVTQIPALGLRLIPLQSSPDHMYRQCSRPMF